ncbi:kynureninase [Pilimelia terevasa]|uniref:Kynureninase n=1 Tax=Pilimelia terevasa TaxID=53372 RepID=A0A8J3BF92_9ACTN|nr:kynureninase [Pilimelia terevasa]GGK15288.1 kynureninase [Pilimelia terevasa]
MDAGTVAARLAPHYARAGVATRLALTGHAFQAWPDVARAAVLAACDDAADLLDGAWAPAAAQADRVRAGYRALLGDPAGTVALAPHTHELVLRFLSTLDLARRPRLVTTNGEFHSLRRQLDRLAEAGLRVVRVPAEPVGSLAARVAGEVDGRTAAVLLSTVLYETSLRVPDLPDLAAACTRHGAELLLDVYHALGVAPVDAAALPTAWLVGGGLKYLQLGGGNCFLRVPAHAAAARPVLTGWFAEPVPPPAPPAVGYVTGDDRFAGATYDPVSHYRAAAVLDFHAAQGLTPALLRDVALRQRAVLTAAFDALDLPPEVVDRDRGRPAAAFGGFLALRTPHAAALRADLAAHGVRVDHRGAHLRLGPAPYLSDGQLAAAVGVLGEAAARLRR